MKANFCALVICMTNLFSFYMKNLDMYDQTQFNHDMASAQKKYCAYMLAYMHGYVQMHRYQSNDYYFPLTPYTPLSPW